jgi:diguanylate cyclase (GGDEF)-like protein
MRLTTISRPVATQPPITAALWHGSGRVATATPFRCYATRVPRRECERRTIVIELPRFATVARRVATRWLVCMIQRTTLRRVGRTSCCGAKRDRERAAADRAKAADDRARAAGDREEAARERAEAQLHRTESDDNLKLATSDELTGAWTRKFGLEQVSRELERARRTGARLMLAFIDVDGLKQVNDSQGHLAGDALLHLVGETLRANVRPYDVIVRYGGDELVCAMPNLSALDARARFDKIAAALTAVNAEHSVTVGLAEADPVDSLQELIARADADLLEARRSRQSND